MALEVQDSEFEDAVVKSQGLVLVDFWAPWCGPCKSLSPILDEISKEMIDKVKIMKMNVDDNQVTPTKYSVRGIPTMILFKDGKHVDTKVGLFSQSVLTDWISTYL